jgi:uncharacterized membrane protein
METLIHADIFFFISTISIVLITIGIVISLVYIIRILRNVSDVSDKVKEESTEILSDVKHLRGTIKQEGFKMSYVFGFFKNLFGRKTRSKKDH